MRLELHPLLQRPVLQIIEIEAGQLRTVLLHEGERLPQRLLGEDAGEEQLQFDQAAQRRVAAQSPVQFEPAGELGSSGDDELLSTGSATEACEDLVERPHVLFDLVAHITGGVGDEAVGVRRGEPPGASLSRRGTRAVVAKVDAKERVALA